MLNSFLVFVLISNFCIVTTIFLFFIFYSTSLSLVGNLGGLTQVRHSSCKRNTTHSYQCVQQKQHYPFLSVCAVSACVQTIVWLPVFGIFNVCTDTDTCDYTHGLYRHCERVCTESWLWEKNPMLHWGLKPVSVLHFVFPIGRSTSLSYCLPCYWAFLEKTNGKKEDKGHKF